MADSMPLILLTVLATLLVCLGLYRTYAAAKKAEPKALALVVVEALHAYEHEVVAKRQEANKAAADAKAAEDQLAQLRAQVSGAAPTA